MRTMIKAIAMLTAIAPTAARAADDTSTFFNGNQLYHACVGSQGERFICQGYVAGSVDQILAMQSMKVLPAPIICGMEAGSAVDIGQITDVVKNYLVAHPENRHYSTANIIFTDRTAQPHQAAVRVAEANNSAVVLPKNDCRSSIGYGG
jgi:hypothetical protein